MTIVQRNNQAACLVTEAIMLARNGKISANQRLVAKAGQYSTGRKWIAGPKSELRRMRAAA